ncbi:MAG: hypothetical protein ABI144_09945 [Gallionella sp.]
MNEKIRQLLNQMSTLEAELNAAVEEHEKIIHYKIEGQRVVFEDAIKAAHLKLKKSSWYLFFTVRPLNFLTMPVIYAMIFPFFLLDLFITFYQLTCFPVYGIARVKRADYIVLDRRYLAYLNIVEKLDCMYCSYGVGLLNYAREITARTEQYFCPIKHARKILGSNERYAHFLRYGDAGNFHDKLEKFRSELSEKDRVSKPAMH